MATIGGTRWRRRTVLCGAKAALTVLVVGACEPALGDEGAVELFTGQALYRIPLVMPVATGAALEPLALEYRSGNGKGGSGWLGLDWRLAGVSSIERDTRRGVPYDYARGPVCGGALCYREQYVLDGEDLLCDEPSCRGPRYRTQIDDGRLIRLEGEFWTVQDRDGTVRRYGTSPQSRLVNPRSGQVFAWLLDWSIDAHGNWAHYEYDQPAGHGVAYLRAIRHAQVGAPANREILFQLDDGEPRRDRSIDYRAGFRREIDRRVEAIEIRAAGERIARYALRYTEDPDSGRSLLAEVERRGRDDSSARPPHRFEYTRSARAFQPQASVWTDLPGCFDARCSLVGGSLLFWPTRSSNLVDLNRDGLIDVHHLEYPDQMLGTSTLGPTEARLHGGRLIRGEPVLWSARGVPFALPTVSSPGLCSNGDCDAGFQVMDLTGDGYPDGAFYGTADSMVQDLLLGGPEGFREPPVAWPRLPFDDNWNTFPAYAQDRFFESEARMLDMTGDGLPDFVQAGDGWQDAAVFPEPGNWVVLWNQGLSEDGSRLRLGDVALEWDRPQSEPIARTKLSSTVDRFGRSDLLDVNGDGLPDRIQVSTQPGVALEVAYGHGAGFDPLEPFAGFPASNVHDGSMFLEHLSVKSGDCTYDGLVDINGDGFLDYLSSESVVAPGIYQGPDPDLPYFWLVAFGTGGGLRSEAAVWRAPEVIDALCIRSDLGSFAFVTELADVNADGLLDKVMGRLDQVVLAEGELPGLLARARSPEGAEVEFHYAGSAQLLDRHDRPANPGLGPTRPVVVRTDRRAGTPASPDIADTYHYARGVLDFGEREFRGFGRVTRSALDGSGRVESETIREFATDRACAGRPTLSVVRRPGRVALARTRHSYLRLARPGASPSDPDAWTACLLETTLESSPEETLHERTRKTVRAYGADPIATHYNVMRVEEWGEMDPSGRIDVGDDERFTHFTYAQPVDARLHYVSRPSEIRVTDASGILQAASRLFYDGEIPAVVGRRGLLLRSDELLFGPGVAPEQGRWVATRHRHDRYGNPTETRGPATRDDPSGLVTALRYDAVFAALPVERREGADLARPLVTEIRYRGCDGLPDPPQGLALPCEIRTPGGGVERMRHDGLGRLVERLTPSGLLEQWTYTDPAPEHPGESIETVLRTAPLAGFTDRWETRRDGLGRPTLEESPGDGARRVRRLLAYDARGRLSDQSAPHFAGDAPGWRRILYDALDRPTESVLPDGETRELRRFEPWREILETYAGLPDPSGRLSFEIRHRDGRGRLVRIDRYPDPTPVDPRSTRPISVTASYDPLDRMVRIDDAVGVDPFWCFTPPMVPERACRQRHDTRITYDSLGRRVGLDDPDAGVVAFEHDDTGRLLRRIDPGGRTLALRYDGLGRPMRLDVSPDGEGAFDASLSYERDPNRPDFGRLVRVTSAGTSYEYAYDGAGNLVRRLQTTLGVRLEQRFAHDELGRLRSRTFPDGETYRYTYAGLLLSRIDAADDPSRVVLAGARYDALGRPEELLVGAAAPEAVRLERHHAPATGRLERIRAVTATGLEAFRTDLAYDGLGRLLAQDGFDAAHPQRAFEYDGLGRLVRATGPFERAQGQPIAVTWSYGYDALGNLRARRSAGGTEELRFEYEHAAKPRFLTAFHAPGETSWIEPDAAGRTASIDGEALRWNAQDRLFHAARAPTLAFYDLEGARTASIGAAGALLHAGEDVDYRLESGLLNKRFRLGSLLLATRATYFAASREDGSLVVPSPGSGPQPGGLHAESLLVYATDALGSVRAVLDGEGTVVETRDYAPYGEDLSHDGPFDLRHRFAGQPFDAAEGLYEMGARRYHPRWARFLSPDELLSLVRAEGTHRYAYAGNQPTSRVDPSGLFWVVPMPETSAPAAPGGSPFWLPVAGGVLLLDIHPPVPGPVPDSAASSTMLQHLASLFPLGYGAEVRLGTLQLRFGQTIEGETFLTYTFVAGGGFGYSIGPKGPPGYRAARAAVGGSASVLVVGGTAEADAQVGPANAELNLSGGVLLIFPADGSPALAVPYHGTTISGGAGGQAGASVQLGAGVVLGGFRLGP